MKRYLVYVDGQVQGVGFRGFCIRIAKTYQITGSVRNMSNGLVEIYAQGTQENLQLFIERLRQGDGYFIEVTDISTKEIPVDLKETQFILRW